MLFSDVETDAEGVVTARSRDAKTGLSDPTAGVPRHSPALPSGSQAPAATTMLSLWPKNHCQLSVAKSPKEGEQVIHRPLLPARRQARVVMERSS